MNIRQQWLRVSFVCSFFSLKKGKTQQKKKMAMEKYMVLRDSHTRSITAIGYNPARKEIAIGYQDGAVRCWEVESGKLTQSSNEHIGWVTDFLYWTDLKVLFSSANDGLILVWGASGGITDKIHLGFPVYSMTINFRWHQLLCGSKAGIRVYSLDEHKRSGHVINPNATYVAKQHTDIVLCILCHEGRVYSAGFDHHFIIYDSSYKNNGKLHPMLINYNAHEAGITCMVLARDSELNFWIVTGSFDNSVRIWSIDGKLIHRLNNFLAPVSSLCYCPLDNTIWVTAGLSSACLLEPKSGDNVTESVGTFQQQEEEKYHLQIVKFVPELNEVIGTTNRKRLIVWKYNSSGCVTALKSRHSIESICYTSKAPILFFSGANEGTITKWERMQSNFFIYSKDEYLLRNARRNETNIHRLATADKNEHKYLMKGDNPPPINQIRSIGGRPKSAIMKLAFVECLDLLVAACEDGNIYVWGFDMAAAEELRKVELEKEVDFAKSKFAVLLEKNSVLLRKEENPSEDANDTVNKRVANFICQHILIGHQGSVTSLVVIDRTHGYNGVFLVSAGWDRKLRIWNLETGELHDIYHHHAKSTSSSTISASMNGDLICDGVILDMDYSQTLNEIGYATSESLAFIRTFSLNGSEMTLKNTLSGHHGDVVAIRWNPKIDKWVTGGEDGTIRIWSSTGLNECEQVLSAHGVIYCMTIDEINGSIVAGVQNTIKVFDIKTYCTVQINVGHSDVVKGVIHVPQRNQYISCSYDQTVRVWNAWKPKIPRHMGKKSVIEDNEKENQTEF